MNGFLKDITYARSGEYILSIYTRESCKDIWKNFGERPITFTITKKADPRGLRANSYAWNYALWKGAYIPKFNKVFFCPDAMPTQTAADENSWRKTYGGVYTADQKPVSLAKSDYQKVGASRIGMLGCARNPGARCR